MSSVKPILLVQRVSWEQLSTSLSCSIFPSFWSLRFTRFLSLERRAVPWPKWRNQLDFILSRVSAWDNHWRDCRWNELRYFVFAKACLAGSEKYLDLVEWAGKVQFLGKVGQSSSFHGDIQYKVCWVESFGGIWKQRNWFSSWRRSFYLKVSSQEIDQIRVLKKMKGLFSIFNAWLKLRGLIHLKVIVCCLVCECLGLRTIKLTTLWAATRWIDWRGSCSSWTENLCQSGQASLGVFPVLWSSEWLHKSSRHMSKWHVFGMFLIVISTTQHSPMHKLALRYYTYFLIIIAFWTVSTVAWDRNLDRLSNKWTGRNWKFRFVHHGHSFL